MTENKLQQIEKLQSEMKTKLAPSKIHGVGVFALRDISKGEKLYADARPTVYTLTYTDAKKLSQEVRDILLGQWPNIINGSHFAYPTTRIQAYINHSDIPNYYAQNDVMLKDVRAGEEITEDYRMIDNYDKIFPWL